MQLQSKPAEWSAALPSDALIGLPEAGSDPDGVFAALLGSLSEGSSPDADPETSKLDAPAGAFPADSGNMLPAIPATPALFPMPGTHIDIGASEAELEEFAVGIGIDRGLARFLLATTGAGQGPGGGLPAAMAATVRDSAQGVSSPALGDEAILKWRESGAVDTAAVTQMEPRGWSPWTSVRAASNPDPGVMSASAELTPPKGTVITPSTLALQSLPQFYVGIDVSGQTSALQQVMTPSTELPAKGCISALFLLQAQDAATRAKRSIKPLPGAGVDQAAGAMVVAVPAMAGQADAVLRTGQTDSDASMPPTVITNENDIDNQPLEFEAVIAAKNLEAAAVAARDGSGLGSKEFEGIALRPASDIAAAALGWKDRKSSGGSAPANFSRRFVENLGSMRESGNLAAGLIGSAQGVQESQSALPSSDPGESALKLRVPDPAAIHEARAQEFAAAVARRVISQVRSEDWNIKLALDPRGLGELKLELALHGGAISGLVTVANQEARSLLEAGLPALKTELEAQGFSMGGWSFGQSAADQSKNYAGNSRGKLDLDTLTVTSAAPVTRAAGDTVALKALSESGSGVDLYI